TGERASGQKGDTAHGHREAPWARRGCEPGLPVTYRIQQEKSSSFRTALSVVQLSVLGRRMACRREGRKSAILQLFLEQPVTARQHLRGGDADRRSCRDFQV